MSDQKGRVAPGSLFDSCGCVGGKGVPHFGIKFISIKGLQGLLILYSFATFNPTS